MGDVNLARPEGLKITRPVGLRITLAGSKTDQHHHGHVVAIPDTSAREATGAEAREAESGGAGPGGAGPGGTGPGGAGPGGTEISPARALATWIGWLRRRPHQHPEEPGPGGVVLPAGAPLWRPVSRRQGADPRARIGTRALSDRAIAEIVKARAAAAGLDGRWSGHSLRRGFATDAYAGGADEVEIMRHGRWRSATTMRGYLEEGTRFRATHPVHRLTFPGQPTQQG